MLRGVFLFAFLVVILSLPTGANARNKAATASSFVTTGWVNLRQGPGTSWPLLAVIPPSTRVKVDFCSTKWSIGWCQATYEGQTGSVHSSLLKIVGPPPAGKAGRKAHYSKPAFLAQAERNYQQARHVFEVERRKLNRLRQEEARLSGLAMAKTGQWMEPTALWRKKLALKQNLAYLSQNIGQARAELDNAENKARSMAVAKWSRAHNSWRRWW